jgi:hypothetical protein
MTAEQRDEVRRLKAQIKSDLYQEFIASDDVQGDQDFIGTLSLTDSFDISHTNRFFSHDYSNMFLYPIL